MAADPFRSRDGGGRDWTKLPSELIALIADWLLRYDLSGYIRLRLVCKEWRRSTAPDPPVGTVDLEDHFRPRRWVMLSNHTGDDTRRFLNLSTGVSTGVRLEALSSHHLETSTEGFLLLRDKVSHAVHLLNPLTTALIDLPPITTDLDKAYTYWTEGFLHPRRTIYAGICDETSPPTIVLTMRHYYWTDCVIMYAKPNDEQWTIMDDECLESLDMQTNGETQNVRLLNCIRFSSVLTLRGHVYLATQEGNLLEVSVYPKPELLAVAVNHRINQFYTESQSVFSYLVPADNHHHEMFMVQYYLDLKHLSTAERKKMKARKNSDLIRVESKYRGKRWQQIKVFKVDLDEKQLVPIEEIGCHNAVFVGEVGCFFLSTVTFPSVAGNSVYLGGFDHQAPHIGVRYLNPKSFDPSFEFTLEGGPVDALQRREWLKCLEDNPELKLVPIVRPCPLQDYLVCCSGIKGGFKDLASRRYQGAVSLPFH